VQVPDTLSFLLGSGTVERRIRDARAGADGTFDGTLTVEPEPVSQLEPHPDPGFGSAATRARRARYEERGLLRLGTFGGPAGRRLVCVGRADGTMLVEFADGRPFVVWDLRSGAWVAHHPCRADHYELRFAVGSADVVEEHWRVGGPAKDYQAWTTYRRVGANAPPGVTAPG
jgi:Family of unknown function (DUF6314)